MSAASCSALLRAPRSFFSVLRSWLELSLPALRSSPQGFSLAWTASGVRVAARARCRQASVARDLVLVAQHRTSQVRRLSLGGGGQRAEPYAHLRPRGKPALLHPSGRNDSTSAIVS